MPRKRANRRKSSNPARRELKLPAIDWAWFGNAALLICIGVGVWFGTTWIMERPINSVRIEGRFQRVTPVQIEAAISPYVEQGFLAVNISDVQKGLRNMPWVQDATVRRSWPSTLNVSVEEERPAARWGKDGLLNVYGELFVEHATHIPAELPLLDGPMGMELEVAQRFFELDTQLEQRGLNAIGLRVDERGAWRLEVNNGMQVRFGAVAVDVRTARFFQALDRVLVPVANEVDYVDMRYTNGFSVGWKPGSRLKLASAGETGPHVW